MQIVYILLGGFLLVWGRKLFLQIRDRLIQPGKPIRSIPKWGSKLLWLFGIIAGFMIGFYFGQRWLSGLDPYFDAPAEFFILVLLIYSIGGALIIYFFMVLIRKFFDWTAIISSSLVGATLLVNSLFEIVSLDKLVNPEMALTVLAVLGIIFQSVQMSRDKKV